MRFLKAIESRWRSRKRRMGGVKPRHRRLVIEQFEDRRLLAVAVDDSYSVGANNPLVVSADGAWGNDSYNASWTGEESQCVHYDHHYAYYDGSWVGR